MGPSRLAQPKVEGALDGQKFSALSGGPVLRFNEAVSFQVLCDSQEQIDYYWGTLTAGGDPTGR